MRILLRLLFAGVFSLAGVMHFVKEEGFTRVVPAYLPFRKLAVWVTGVIEIIIGLRLIIGRPSKLFKKLMNWFLLSVFPANIYMARKKLPLGDIELPKSALYGRLPLQFVMMYLIKKL
ncbi:DoxX family protein [Staphylococcus massiliensis]|uniref:DoxX family protein n=1 Tax=Staphylococcus massiliensis S46 TaxID=1229783 RepID=K9B066_9STAP|nr:DoxX family membrane protein [Staphylococcus massiliensis]EKU48202.1 hypothetical protein C273_05832 [Staphylococcus massiliensis S46]MCG3399537.1 DoxX family membrane protein [Staphylococcus massiliensis]MCG3402046.1 DoxX family membrane protein [Staphylococcus massiliensis]MCG3412703.1 DoxX family membrane protein [Staphylococcus massiliensis]POA00747.1 DoxX family membrane protein [Staphylococcus massiliensis CCUG 55927]